MDIIEATDLEKVKDIELPIIPKKGGFPELVKIEDFEAELKKMETPVEQQKELATKLKFIIDQQMNRDIERYGELQSSTGAWVKLYNDALDRLHKNLHGEKNVSLHLHEISHAHIAQKIREVSPKKEE